MCLDLELLLEGDYKISCGETRESNYEIFTSNDLNSKMCFSDSVLLTFKCCCESPPKQDRRVTSILHRYMYYTHSL